jgi:hypothetical protein
MPFSAVDVLLGSLVLGLAGWSLVQAGSARAARRGGCGGCASDACGSGEETDGARRDPAGGGGEPLASLGGSRGGPARGR